MIDVLSPVPWFDFFDGCPKLILLRENRRDFLDGNGSGNREWVTENPAGGHTNEEAESTLRVDLVTAHRDIHLNSLTQTEYYR